MLSLRISNDNLYRLPALLSWGLPIVLGSLSSNVFERRTSTGSELFSLLICLDESKFVLLSAFTLIETICPEFVQNHGSSAQKVHFRLTWVAQKRCWLNPLFLNPVVPNQIFPQSRQNTQWWFDIPHPRAYFQSRISPQFCFEIPNPEFFSRAKREPEIETKDFEILAFKYGKSRIPKNLFGT